MEIHCEDIHFFHCIKYQKVFVSYVPLYLYCLL